VCGAGVCDAVDPCLPTMLWDCRSIAIRWLSYHCCLWFVVQMVVVYVQCLAADFDSSCVAASWLPGLTIAFLPLGLAVMHVHTNLCLYACVWTRSVGSVCVQRKATSAHSTWCLFAPGSGAYHLAVSRNRAYGEEGKMVRCGFIMFCAFLQGVVPYTEECATSTSKGPRAGMFGKALISGNPLVCVFAASVVCMWCACVVHCTVLSCVHLPAVC
jgi:hypothetical protein